MKSLFLFVAIFCAFTSKALAEQYVITDYVSTPVTTSAWVQIIAATQYGTNKLHVFDSSGQTLLIGFGSSGQETAQFVIPPGGIEEMLINIPIGTRVSLKAVSNSTSGNATSGESVITLIKTI